MSTTGGRLDGKVCVRSVINTACDEQCDRKDHKHHDDHDDR